jgi:hypothetical protein
MAGCIGDSTCSARILNSIYENSSRLPTSSCAKNESPVRSEEEQAPFSTRWRTPGVRLWALNTQRTACSLRPKLLLIRALSQPTASATALGACSMVGAAQRSDGVTRAGRPASNTPVTTCSQNGPSQAHRRTTAGTSSPDSQAQESGHRAEGIADSQSRGRPGTPMCGHRGARARTGA